ncbi:hypothetical protein AMTRI_Chr07g81890 [Amborella trichopoda]
MYAQDGCTQAGDRCTPKKDVHRRVPDIRPGRMYPSYRSPGECTREAGVRADVLKTDVPGWCRVVDKCTTRTYVPGRVTDVPPKTDVLWQVTDVRLGRMYPGG